jgi:Ca-activated chloride channel family protein
VTSRLDEGRLREIAETAGGFYVHLQGGPAEMQQIVREGLGKMKERDSDSRFTKQPIERYQWPLAGAVVFAISALLIGERRRGLRKANATAVAAILFLLGIPVQAAPEADFNRGCDAFKTGDYSAAAQAFSVAMGTGEARLQAKAAYNLANTLARRGAQLEKKEEKIAEWKNALQHYDRALSLETNHADAKYNRDLVEKAIADLEKEQKEEQKQDQQDKQEKKDDEKKDEKKDNGEDDKKSDQNEKDQQQKPGEQKDEKGEKGEKEQQQKGGGAGDEQKEQSKKEGADSKEGKKEDQQQAPQNGEKKSGESQQGEKKEGEGKVQPAPDPAQNQPPKQGELKAGNAQPEGPNGESPKDEAAEEAAAAAEGRMTDKQAKALLESIKDARPRLLDPRDVERRPTRGFKDW